MKKVKLYLNYAGHCIAKENDAIQGGRKQKITFQALWGLIEHPEKGWILYDTGYTERFYKATKHFPNKIYALITKVNINPENEVKKQLERHNISAKDIKHVIITHFHADHVAGMLDFPEASFYTSRAAFTHMNKMPKFISFSKGILKDLHPKDLDQRTQIIEELCKPIADDVFGTKYDLFGDNSILIIPLPGHAAGQIGVIIETEKSPYFLIADACWLKKSYEDLILPNPIVKLFFHSWKDFKKSLNSVHRYHKANPETIIVPTHCSASTDPLVADEIRMNVL